MNFPAPPQFKFNGDNKPLFADPVKSLGNGATISGPVERPTILLRPNLDIPPPPLGFSQRLPEFRNQGLRRGEPLDAQNIFISPRKPYKIPISPSQSPKLNLPLPAYTKKPSNLFEKGNSVVTAPQGPQQTISSSTIVVPVEESEVFPPQASPVLQAETTEKNVKTTEDPRKYLPTAVNTGFKQQSIVFETGFQPIKTGNINIPDLAFDVSEEEEIEELAQPSFNSDPFKGKVPDSFNPVFRPSRLDFGGFNQSQYYDEEAIKPVKKNVPKLVGKPVYPQNQGVPYGGPRLAVQAIPLPDQSPAVNLQKAPSHHPNFVSFQPGKNQVNKDSYGEPSAQFPTSVLFPPGTLPNFQGQAISYIGNPVPANAPPVLPNQLGNQQNVFTRPQFGPFRGELPPQIPRLPGNLPQFHQQRPPPNRPVRIEPPPTIAGQAHTLVDPIQSQASVSRTVVVQTASVSVSVSVVFSVIILVIGTL